MLSLCVHRYMPVWNICGQRTGLPYARRILKGTRALASGPFSARFSVVLQGEEVRSIRLSLRKAVKG